MTHADSCLPWLLTGSRGAESIEWLVGLRCLWKLMAWLPRGI